MTPDATEVGEQVTLSEAARRIGVSPTTLSKLVTRGLITRDGSGYVWHVLAQEYDTYVANRQRNGGQGRPPVPRKPWPRPRPENGAAPPPQPSHIPAPPPPEPEENPRNRKLRLEADRLELQVSELRGKLVALGDVRRMISEPLARVDTRIRAIPMRFGPELAQRSGLDPIESMGILDDIVAELRAALNAVGRYTPGDPVPGVPGLGEGGNCPGCGQKMP